MNKNFIFIKDNNDSILYYLSFIPLIFYGLYKNGYLLFTNNYVSFFNAYKILLYPFLLLIIAIVFSFIFKRRKRYVIIYALIMGIASPYNTNLYLYLLIVTLFMFVIEFIPNKYKINEPAFLISTFIVVNHYSHSFSICNPMEVSNTYSYSLLDLFFGRGSSFMFTSSVFWLLISYFIMSFRKTYKKMIPVIETVIFTILVIIYSILTKDYLNNFSLLLNGTTFFSFIYLSTINESSPSTNKVNIIYCVLTSLLAFIFIYFLNIYTGAVLSVFVISLLYRLYEIIRQKLFLKNYKNSASL